MNINDSIDLALLNISKRNYSEALKELMSLNIEGNLISNLYIGIIYERGLGVAIDMDKAVQFYSAAAKLGNLTAQRHLAGLLRKMGRNSEAFNWYEVAAEAGSASACYWLYVMYRDGRGVPANQMKSREFLERSSSFGHLYAKRDLAKSDIRGERGFIGIFKGLWSYIHTPFVLFAALRNDSQSDDIHS